MMLLGNRKFLKHFNSAHRINNSHQHYAEKKLRIYCLPKVVMIGSFILLHNTKAHYRQLFKDHSTGLKMKQLASSSRALKKFSVYSGL
jgi:hypothetical protein